MLRTAATFAGQALLYAAFAAFIGYFATQPSYRQIADDIAIVKLSISHLGERECRKRSAEELEKLPRNMRAPLDCPRERSDIRVELDIDGQNVVSHVMTPTGLYKDGVSTMYRRLEVKAGPHTLAVRMQDDARKEGWRFTREERVELKPAQNLVIDFHPDKGGLFFK